MGSIISKIYDDYDTYTEMCKIKGIEPMDIRDKDEKGNSWFVIMNQWVKKDGCKSEYEWFSKNSKPE